MKLVVEYIYCFYSPQFPLRGKVCVSNDVERRRAQIEQEIRYKHGQHVRVKCLVKMPILTNAYNFEAALHRGFDGLYWRSKTMSGTNGETEWWKYLNFVCGILAYLIGYAYGWPVECRLSVTAFILAFPFFPLDLALCVILLALAEYAILGGAAWVVFSLLT